MEKSVDGGCSCCSSSSAAPGAPASNFFSIAREIISLHISAGSGDIAIDFRAYKIPGPERQSCSHNFVDSEPGMVGWHSLGKGLQLQSLHLVKTRGSFTRRAIINRWYMVTLRLLIFVKRSICRDAHHLEGNHTRNIGLSVPYGMLSGTMCDQSRQWCDPETQDTCCTWKHQTSCEPFHRPRSVVAWVGGHDYPRDACSREGTLANLRNLHSIHRKGLALTKRRCQIAKGRDDVLLQHSLRYGFFALRNSSAL